MGEEDKLDIEIRSLLTSQKFGVLSTQEKDHPYLSLVAFAETTDLRTILFATTRTTRKFKNISSRAGVALLVDNRSNEAADIHEAMAITAVGTACEISQLLREKLNRVYLEKQPYMREFLSSPSTALVKIDVENYLLVRHFQKVAILNLPSLPRSDNGNADGQ
ncbi:MAG: pyridoxamine 5'-phosphate oxidase family protein [Desulfomonile sp.]